jgi:hypothetical protein
LLAFSCWRYYTIKYIDIEQGRKEKNSGAGGQVMATLQVRSIDDQLYKALGRRAAMDNRSISQEVVAIIKAYLSSPKARHENSTHDFLEICGSWADERDADEIIRDIMDDRRAKTRFQDLF